MKKAHLKKLEKLARQMERLNADFQKLADETKHFDYDGNGIIAAGRVSAAASIINTLCNQLQTTTP